ncbi:MAG: hypothetical protein AB7Y46_08745, partial [Armatimonadota bacterium]
MRTSGAIAGMLIVVGVVCAQELGPNLVVNGDFEGEDPGGWRFSEQRHVVELPDAPSGSHALMMRCDEAQYYFAIAGPDVPIQPRTLYRVMVKIRRESGAGALHVGGGLLDAEGKGLMRGDWALGAYPISLQPGEGRGAWHEYSGEFITNRTDAAALALRIILRDGVDTFYVDDVAIQRAERPEAPPLRLPDDVIWPGRPSAMGMHVEGVVHGDGVTTVVTTGARLQFAAEGSSLICRQRIPAKREVVRFSFDPPLGALSLGRCDEDVCVLLGDECALSINPDGLIALGTNRPVTITATSAIVPRHYVEMSDNLLAIDEEGGFCIYPEQRLEYESEPSIFTQLPEDTSLPGWTATLLAGARKLVALGVFPPRPFPWAQSFQMRIAHSNHYPADEQIRWMAEYCNVLVLHQNIYAGGLSSGPYIIEDDGQYARVIATAHDAGMQVLPYFNPGAYTERDLDAQIALLRAHRERYGTDGFYFDGLGRGEEWPWSYEFIRTVREMVGDAAIYTHCTLNPPVNATTIYCPFIDTWSDFLLRGEGQTIRGVQDPYLRYVVGTWNISNAIATLKGDKMEGADERAQLQIMLDLHGRARWPYPGTNEERDR